MYQIWKMGELEQKRDTRFLNKENVWLVKIEIEM